MSNDGDDNNNVINLSEWRGKKTKSKQQYNSKVVWVSDSSPKLIVRLNELDLTVDLIGYNKNNTKHYFRRLTLLEVATMLKAIQNEYSKY